MPTDPIYSVEPGHLVQSIADPRRRGIVRRLGKVMAGHQYVDVFWQDTGATTSSRMSDLRVALDEPLSPFEQFVHGHLGSAADLQRLVTIERLKRDRPIRNNIHAFNASRTQFYAYQFKPLLKLLESPKHRLLIADEVGLGKTIEAGLILTELESRQDLRRVLVLAPANLRTKWKTELKTRFDAEFRVFGATELAEHVEERLERWDREQLRAIVSLETIRSPRLQAVLPELDVDLLIVDEAHHARNSATGVHRAVRAVAASAAAVLFLTATPIHLRTTDLFNLLNILDDDDFPDPITTDERLHANAGVLSAQRALASTPVQLGRALESLARLSESPWFATNALLQAVQVAIAGHLSPESRALTERERVDLQRDLAELSLLGHIVTRTKKRDVHHDAAIRRARAIPVPMYPGERLLYERVTTALQERLRDSAISSAWATTTPLRRLASSVHAMAEYYHDVLVRDDSLEEEDYDAVSGTDRAALSPEVVELVRDWPKDAPDSKYNALRQALAPGGEVASTEKIVVFATYRHTLAYLKRRLVADGVGVELLTSDVLLRDRTQVVERFRDDGAVRILLSSRVGSEGLDLQFASCVVNYDLPWNPMEVEQRIGRLDRIGQKSSRILILNLWHADTIEARILARLYERVNLFEFAMGDLEAILGEILPELHAVLFSPHLSEAEQEERVLHIEAVIRNRQAAQDDLDRESAELIGADDFFTDEVSRVQRQRRYVTEAQMARFVRDFLIARCPRSRLEPLSGGRRHRLHVDRALVECLQIEGHAGDALTIVGAAGNFVDLTLNQEEAYAHSSLDFVNVNHPLTQTIVSWSQQQSLPGACQLSVTTDAVPAGQYVLAVFKRFVRSARSYQELDAVLLNDRMHEVGDAESAERLLAEVVETGVDVEPPGFELEPAEAAAFADAAESVFDRRSQSLRSSLSQTNDAFLSRRTASIQRFFGRRLASERELLQRGITDQLSERYLRLRRGKIGKLEGDMKAKLAELDTQREVAIEHSQVVLAILSVRRLGDSNLE